MLFHRLGDLLGTLSRAHIAWFTYMFGAPAGVDEFGNRYYTRATAQNALKPQRRWVVYAARDEASNVPPEWHGWLHYQTDVVPVATNTLRRRWQQPYEPNMTGTVTAYLPPGHMLAADQRDKATGDYEAWQPE